MDTMTGTGYANTFTTFRQEIDRLFSEMRDADALKRLQNVNRFQWLSRISAFDVAEVMWTDGTYAPDEIVEHWLTLTSF